MVVSLNSIKITLLLSAVLALGGPSLAQSGEVLVIKPLFEYPTAPEEIESLPEKSNYLVEHFWDAMDFKNQSSVDQNALNDAFSVYVTPMRWADEAVANASINKLTTKLAKNPVMSLQFAKAAEEVLYSPRAEYWNDDILVKFLDNAINCKGVKKERKLRYQQMRNQVANTMRGSVPPEFDYTRPDGSKAHYHPNGVITIIEFGDPDCDDCRLAKLKMDTNVRLSQLVDRGRVNVMFINVDPNEGWEGKLKDYPDKWHVGASDEVGEIYDLRVTPSIYVIDSEGHVAAKNIPVMTAIDIAVNAAQ